MTVTAAVPPRLADLVPDARALSGRQLTVALFRPVVPLLVFVVSAARGWWPLTAMAMGFLFASTVVVIHDLFHRNLGLDGPTNDALLTIYGLLLLNSGHALARSHLHHHRVYPGEGDPEAYVDGWPLWRVVLEGPVYRLHVWRWAWRHTPTLRRVMAFEMSVWAGAGVLAAASGTHRLWLTAYVVLAELGSWTFPLISVTGVHDRHAGGPLRQTRTLRAPVLGRMLLGMQYHLEHHLYPRVPAARLPEVATALDPWLAAQDAAVWRGLSASLSPSSSFEPELERELDGCDRAVAASAGRG